MTILKLTITSLLAAFAALCSLLSPPPASAAPGDPDYYLVDVFFDFGGEAYAGGYLTCPPGTRSLSWGGTLAPAYGFLTAGVTTWNLDGAFVTAFDGFHQGSLQASARCVASSRLNGQTLVTSTTRNPDWGFRPYVRAATCPTGSVPFGGGSWISGSTQDSTLFGSFPDRNGWTAGMVADLFGGQRELWVSTHCLPRAKLGNVVTMMETATGPNSWAATNIYAGARCPAGYFAFAGGAWFHPIGDLAPVAHGRLHISNMAADNRGWFAKGHTTYPNTQLSTRVMCTDRLG